jgi:hypothetical protein
MGSVFKKAVTRPLPPGSEFIVRQGCDSPDGETEGGRSGRHP